MRLPLFLCATLLAASASDAAPGARKYQLAGFTSVSLSGSDRLVVRAGQRYSVRAVGERLDLDRMTMEVRDGSLHIGRRSERLGGRLAPSRTVTVTVTLPRLDAVALAGSGSATVDAVRGDDFQMALSGSGGIRAQGAARKLSLAVKGSGGIDARALDARTVQAAVSGSGSIRGVARDNASIAVRGSGTVRLTGTNRCQIATAGSGTARCG